MAEAVPRYQPDRNVRDWFRQFQHLDAFQQSGDVSPFLFATTPNEQFHLRNTADGQLRFPHELIGECNCLRNAPRDIDQHVGIDNKISQSGDSNGGFAVT